MIFAVLAMLEAQGLTSKLVTAAASIGGASTNCAYTFEVDSIRIPTERDFDTLLLLTRMRHEESDRHPLSEQKLWQLIVRGICRDNAIVGVIGAPGELKAAIYLSIEETYYSDDFQIVELFSFVRPDARRTDFASRLIKFAKRCADETGLDLLALIDDDANLAAKQRLYERHLPKGGAYYFYRGARDPGRRDALDRSANPEFSDSEQSAVQKRPLTASQGRIGE